MLVLLLFFLSILQDVGFREIVFLFYIREGGVLLKGRVFFRVIYFGFLGLARVLFQRVVVYFWSFSYVFFIQGRDESSQGWDISRNKGNQFFKKSLTYFYFFINYYFGLCRGERLGAEGCCVGEQEEGWLVGNDVMWSQLKKYFVVEYWGVNVM